MTFCFRNISQRRQRRLVARRVQVGQITAPWWICNLWVWPSNKLCITSGCESVKEQSQSAVNRFMDWMHPVHLGTYTNTTNFPCVQVSYYTKVILFVVLWSFFLSRMLICCGIYCQNLLQNLIVKFVVLFPRLTQCVWNKLFRFCEIHGKIVHCALALSINVEFWKHSTIAVIDLSH